MAAIDKMYGTTEQYDELFQKKKNIDNLYGTLYLFYTNYNNLTMCEVS